MRASKHCHISSGHLLHINYVYPATAFGRCYLSRSMSQRAKLPAVQSANVEKMEEVGVDGTDKVRVLKRKMRQFGINPDDSCIPGFFSLLFCPKCQGGRSVERSLSLHIIQDADFAMWRCYHTGCGWAGQAFADSRATTDGMNKIFKVKQLRETTAVGMVLEPLSSKLIDYFSERMISVETLQRNAVMQMASNQDVIAFTYRQNGAFVGCKYRTLEKRFWQVKGTEKWLYGIDDLKAATEAIIVEGEIDKLSIEEAGFHNCVSVPAGAPRTVSAKDLPSVEKDKAYQYLWNCKDYLGKISRIILATDSDTSGQSLAEELARRLGKDRCWLVRWPMKDGSSRFKDANEVLKCLGPVGLKEAIASAELYEAS